MVTTMALQNYYTQLSLTKPLQLDILQSTNSKLEGVSTNLASDLDSDQYWNSRSNGLRNRC